LPATNLEKPAAASLIGGIHRHGVVVTGVILQLRWNRATGHEVAWPMRLGLIMGLSGRDEVRRTMPRVARRNKCRLARLRIVITGLRPGDLAWYGSAAPA